MVSAAVARSANAKSIPSTVSDGFTAVFLGATSGIGRSALEQLVAESKGKKIRVYVVGRSLNAATELIAGLRQSNSAASIEFIEKDVSLVRAVDEAVAIIKERESKVDLLFESMGYMPFGSRQETTEGLEPSMTTRYYSRARAIQLLLPLLNASPNPHVTNILAGGQEAPLIDQDLDLTQPGNFSFIQASKHSATMLTLALERFATENPKISFVHAFPGPVATDTLKRGSGGVLSFLMRWVVAPFVNTFVAASASDAGAKSLLYATNARYTVSETEGLAAPVPEGLEKVRQSKGGVFLVDQNGEGLGDEKVLEELRTKSDLVWKHTTAVFDRVSA